MRRKQVSRARIQPRPTPVAALILSTLVVTLGAQLGCKPRSWDPKPNAQENATELLAVPSPKQIPGKATKLLYAHTKENKIQVTINGIANDQNELVGVSVLTNRGAPRFFDEKTIQNRWVPLYQEQKLKLTFDVLLLKAENIQVDSGRLQVKVLDHASLGGVTYGNPPLALTLAKAKNTWTVQYQGKIFDEVLVTKDGDGQGVKELTFLNGGSTIGSYKLK